MDTSLATRLEGAGVRSLASSHSASVRRSQKDPWSDPTQDAYGSDVLQLQPRCRFETLKGRIGRVKILKMEAKVDSQLAEL